MCTAKSGRAHNYLRGFIRPARRILVSMGVFGIPVGAYLLDSSTANIEPYVFVWIACYVVTLVFLAATLIVLIGSVLKVQQKRLKRVVMVCG